MKTLFFYCIFEIISLMFIYAAQTKRNKYLINNNKKNISIKSTSNLTIKRYNIIFFLSMVPIIILIGLRNISVGYDTSAYVEVFFRVLSDSLRVSDSEWLSVGYIFLCKIIGFFSNDSYVLYNLTFATLTVYFLYKSIWENSKNPVFSIFILFSTCLVYQAFNQSRQMLAISMMLYAWKYIEKKQIKKYLLMCLLAFSIHKSALVMLPFYWISKIKINKKTLIKYTISSTFIFAFFGTIKKVLLMTYYGKTYLDRGFFSSQTSTVFNLIFRLGLLFACLYYSKYIKEDEKKELNGLFNMSIWCIMFQLLTLKIYIFGRITTYFYIFYVLLIPNIYAKISSKKKKTVFLVMNIFLFVIFHICYFFLVSASSGYDEFFWFFQSRG